MQDIFYFMISYGVIIFGGFFLINWLSNGYVWRLFRVKASRGKKVLVWSRGSIQYNFYIGMVVEGMLIFRDKACELEGREAKKRLALPKGALFRAMGIVNVITDEETNSIIKPDMKGVTGFDPIKWNNLFVRALKKPSLKDDNLLQIINLILVILILLGIIVIFVKLNQVDIAVKSLSVVSKGNVI